MKRIIKAYSVMAFLLLVILFPAITAYAADCEFTAIAFPKYHPYTPRIVSNSNSVVASGLDSFTVYADFEGQVAKELCCDPSGGGGTGPQARCEHECEPDCDFSVCEISHFYGEADPRVYPNPACIPGDVDPDGLARSACSGATTNPIVYYYFNNDTSDGGSLQMNFNTSLGVFSAEIPLTDRQDGDTVTWYFAASDNLGNVVVQSPDPDMLPCDDIDNWISSYESPATDNCAVSNIYWMDYDYYQETPVCWSTDFTVNDLANDTQIGYDPCAPEVGDIPPGLDIYGFSVGTGASTTLGGAEAVCAKMKLSESPSAAAGDSNFYSTYAFMFFNPDIVDPNPIDMIMPNLIVVSYTPGIEAVDPNLEKVLWDGDCLTNPNTAEPLSCKLIVGGGAEERFKISVQGDEIVVFIKNILPNGDTIIGSASKSFTAYATTGQLDPLANGLFFTGLFSVDITSQMRFVASNQSAVFGEVSELSAPILFDPPTCEWPDGTSFFDTCNKSSEKPEKNTCKIAVAPSPDCLLAQQYNIYYNTVDDRSTATVVETIDSSLCDSSQYVYDITETELDGATRYFYASTVFQDNGPETNSEDWATVSCTPEDWIAPTQEATSLQCVTPAGNYGICECSWNLDTTLDPSMNGYKVWRDSSLLTLSPFPITTGADAYSYTDSSDSLVAGNTYSYTIKLLDSGNNISAGVSASCTPEDLEAPSKVDSLSFLVATSTAGVTLNWQSVTDDDVGGYNVLFCEETTPDVDCLQENTFTKMNSSLITNSTQYTDTSSFTDGNSYCFWVQACDDCDTAGTCPSNAGSPNCSNFSSLATNRKCVEISTTADSTIPDFPTGLSASAPYEGDMCELSWDPVCTDNSGQFSSCSYPTAAEISGYYVMREKAPAGESDCSNTTVPSPATGIPAGVAPVDASPSFTDNGLNNGDTYCYRVYAFDAYNNFSNSASVPDLVSCRPIDTVAAPSPQLAGIEFTASTCTPQWNAVEDKDPVLYHVYRCNDEPGNCGNSGLQEITGSPVSGLSYEDTVPLTEQNYTYCIVTEDDDGNISDVISVSASSAEDSDNCGFCFPSSRPASPGNVQAGAYSVDPNYGINVWWTDSIDDDGSGAYNVYVCLEEDYSLSGCFLIGDSVSGSRTSESPFEVSNAQVPLGAYYAAVTYEETEESFPVFFDTPVSIAYVSTDPCEADPVPSYCTITISVSGAFKRLGLVEDGGTYTSNATPLTGVSVYVVTDETDISTAIASKYVDTKGIVGSFNVMESLVSEGQDYSIVAKLPAASFDDAYEINCKNDVDVDGYCLVRLSKTVLEANASVSASAKVIPPAAASGGYGAEVGNPNGDGAVNLFDLAAIKNSMNTTSSDPCYRQWADLNLDGNINLFDLAVIKDNMGTQFDNNDPDFDPALVESKDPLPAECR